MKVVICHGFVSQFFCKVFFKHPNNLTSSPRESQKHQTPATAARRGARNFWHSAVRNLRPMWVVPFVWKDFARILNKLRVFFGKAMIFFWGKFTKSDILNFGNWVRFNLWMAYLYHRLILRCEIQSLNSDVQSNHGFGISYILWSTYIYLADSMAIQGRCIPTKSDLYFVHVWNFQVYKVGSYRGL